jgi:integrase
MSTQANSIERIHVRTKLPECNEIVSFFKAIIINRKMMGLSYFNYDIALKYLTKFTTENGASFRSINGQWIETLREFFLNTSSLKNEQRLSANSAGTYYSIILSVINEAIQQRYVDATVIKTVKPIKRAELKTEALSAMELSVLAESHCDCIILKKAFLFSSLTGIQGNELKLLTWNDIEKIDNSFQLNLRTSKDPRTIPLSIQAYGLLDRNTQPDDRIFGSLKWNAYLYIILNKWAIRAGIFRNLTFQSARLTFARLLHEKGIQTEIIAELLGHKHPKSTIRLTQQYLSAVA